MKNVKIYTKDFCPYCVKVKNFFKEKGVDFEEVDITNDIEMMEQLIELTGMRTVPQVFIGDKCYGGCDDILSLEEKGELDTILQE